MSCVSNQDAPTTIVWDRPARIAADDRPWRTDCLRYDVLFEGSDQRTVSTILREKVDCLALPVSRGQVLPSVKASDREYRK